MRSVRAVGFYSPGTHTQICKRAHTHTHTQTDDVREQILRILSQMPTGGKKKKKNYIQTPGWMIDCLPWPLTFTHLLFHSEHVTTCETTDTNCRKIISPNRIYRLDAPSWLMVWWSWPPPPHPPPVNTNIEIADVKRNLNTWLQHNCSKSLNDIQDLQIHLGCFGDSGFVNVF